MEKNLLLHESYVIPCAQAPKKILSWKPFRGEGETMIDPITQFICSTHSTILNLDR